MSKQTRITHIEIYKQPIPLKEPFITSLGREESADNVVVVIRTSNGITGFGECNPFMPINGESMDTCFIVAQYFAKVLIGKDPLLLEHCMALLDKVIYGNNSIKSAFNIALLDISGQYHSLPLYKLLGGKQNKDLYTDYTVSVDEPEKMAIAAVKIKEQEFPAIKVKLGQSRKKDIKRIKAIREAVGYEIPLRIDANQGWKVKTAIETLQALGAYEIEFCEEPIARWNYTRLRKVKQHSPIPIMADESVSDHHDASRLIKMRACDLINIKVGKAGGLSNALKIIQVASRAGIHMQVGAFMESRLAMTASAHLALTSDHILYCDFDTPLMHAEDHVQGGLKYEHGGRMIVPDEPGLGAFLPQNILDKLEKAVFQ